MRGGWEEGREGVCAPMSPRRGVGGRGLLGNYGSSERGMASMVYALGKSVNTGETYHHLAGNSRSYNVATGILLKCGFLVLVWGSSTYIVCLLAG